MRRLKPTWAGVAPYFYWFATHAVRLILTVLTRWSVSGRERVPREGGILVVSNHLHFVDPPVVAAAVLSRRVRFMAKIELFKYPFGVVPRLYGAFPVRRFESDLGALMTAERTLKQGGAVGMFPEGTRSRTGVMGKPHPGSALIALRSGATIVPCAVTGTERLANLTNLLRRPRVHVSIGEPIAVERTKKPTEEQVSELTERVFAEIRAMLPPSSSAAYTEEHGRDHSGE